MDLLYASCEVKRTEEHLERYLNFFPSSILNVVVFYCQFTTLAKDSNHTWVLFGANMGAI